MGDDPKAPRLVPVRRKLLASFGYRTKQDQRS